MSILTEIFNPESLFLQPYYENIYKGAGKAIILTDRIKTELDALAIPESSYESNFFIKKRSFIAIYYTGQKVAQYVGIHPLGVDLSICHFTLMSPSLFKTLQAPQGQGILTESEIISAITLGEWLLAVRKRVEMQIKKLKEEINKDNIGINSNISQRGVFDFSPGF